VQHENIDGVEVHARWTEKVARVYADAPGSERMRLELLPSGVTTALGKLFGGQDVRVDDEAFDYSFMIKASDAELARVWLTRKVRRALLVTEGFRFELEDGRAAAESFGPAPWDGVHRRVLEAVAALAGAGDWLASGCRAAAERTGSPWPGGSRFPLSGFSLAGTVAGLGLQVECVPAPRWHTLVRAPHLLGPLRFTATPLAEDVQIVLDAAPEHSAAARAMLTRPVKRALFGADAVAGIDESGAYVRWPGAEPDPERIDHAVSLLSEWSRAAALSSYR
jgi:hypothetical protein